MSELRLRLAPLLVAVALVVGLPTVAADASRENCERYHAESVPLLHPAVDVGFVELCDEDGDESVDTLRFDTDQVHSDGAVSVTSEEKDRSSHRDDKTQVKVRASPSGPYDPVVYQKTEVNDDGDDGEVDSIENEGGVFTDTDDTLYVLNLRDMDDDGTLDSYGLLVCGTNGCEAPDPRVAPTVPERIDLPDLVFRIDPVGPIP